MKRMHQKSLIWFLLISLSLSGLPAKSLGGITVPSQTSADGAQDKEATAFESALLYRPALAEHEEPMLLEMTMDAVIVRPLSLGATVLGSAVWFISLPFTLIGGNAKKSWNQLVVEPAKYTFVRPMGHMEPNPPPMDPYEPIMGSSSGQAHRR